MKERRIDLASYHLLTKPVGAACNFACDYCYFLSKGELHGKGGVAMNRAMLERYVRQLLASSPGPEVQIAWQGGEPMLRGLDFYERAVELAYKHRKPHQSILFTMQTNGALIDEAWAHFFKKHGFLIGLSLDGPREMHDAYRVTKKGEGSFDAVLAGWECLKRHGVDVNILCTVHAANQDHPLEIYRFFRDELGAAFIQLIPIVERATAETIEATNRRFFEKDADRPLYRQEGALVTERSVSSEKFGRFLISIFDEWVKRDVGKVYVTTFDVALGSWLGQHNLCIVAPKCGRSLAMLHNGDVYSCDHYVEPGFLLGNIKETPLKHLVNSERQQRFGDAKLETLPGYCRDCEVVFACYGECPRNRFIQTPDGEEGLNYLCAGYKAFFTHVDKPLRRMADLLRQGRFADEIMASADA